MIELLLDAIVALGSNEMQNVLTSVGESAVKKIQRITGMEEINCWYRRILY